MEAKQTATPTQEPKEPQVMGRVHNDRGQCEAWLNSVGRHLPDNAPLYAEPVAAQPQDREHIRMLEQKAFAFDEWIEKTNWVQEQIGTFPVRSLGMHRADVMRDEIARLRAAQAAPAVPEGSYWRKEVRAFADAMETKLRENDHKPGWKRDRPDALFERLQEEVTELSSAISRGDDGTMFSVLSEAADVANFCMMIADVFGALPPIAAAPSAPAARACDAHDEMVKALQAFMAMDPSFCRVCDSTLDRMAAKGNLLAKVVKQARAALTKAGAA